jgi:two-component system alkaline phosphatase synthesis response regulator PhoP
MPRVLIADDNPANAELIEAHLDGAGYETRIADNGEDTLTVANDWRPDVILLDLMMPKLSGFEVCKRLRQDPTHAKTAVLMITALDQVADIDRAVEAGTDDFITKPINKAELLLRLKALLAARDEATPVERTLAYLKRVQMGG